MGARGDPKSSGGRDLSGPAPKEIRKLHFSVMRKQKEKVNYLRFGGMMAAPLV